MRRPQVIGQMTHLLEIMGVSTRRRVSCLLSRYPDRLLPQIDNQHRAITRGCSRSVVSARRSKGDVVAPHKPGYAHTIVAPLGAGLEVKCGGATFCRRAYTY